LAQGPAASHAALITRGLVKITADSHTFLTIRSEGDLIGEEAAILGPQAGSGLSGLTVATALTSGTAQVFTAEQLRRFLEGQPAAMFSVAQGLCERLADAEARIASAARDNADRRLARLLCDLERYGTPDWAQGREGLAVPVPFTHAELASWVGVSRETVDRALRRWRARHIVSTSFRKIVIHDVEALARIAGIKVTRRPAVRPGYGRIIAREVTIDDLRRDSVRHQAAG
jgi:CRP/FNR family cyclic AMP-dependent transcriptional regulator